jgi:hypothetical protein
VLAYGPPFPAGLQLPEQEARRPRRGPPSWNNPGRKQVPNRNSGALGAGVPGAPSGSRPLLFQVLGLGRPRSGARVLQSIQGEGFGGASRCGGGTARRLPEPEVPPGGVAEVQSADFEVDQVYAQGPVDVATDVAVLRGVDRPSGRTYPRSTRASPEAFGAYYPSRGERRAR